MTVTFSVDVLGRGPRAGKAEVGDFESTLEVDEDVGGFQVEVDVPGVVDEVQALHLD